MTAPANPLIAPRHDSTTWYSGATLVEGIVDVKNGIDSGSWVSTGIGSAFVVVDAALLVVDPLGSLLSWGVAWLIEHLKPLSDALEWLAGDPDQVAANAQTWANVAQHTLGAAIDLREAVWRDLAAWAGPGADAYRSAASVEFEALRGFAESAAAKSSAVALSGNVVLVVRTIVRDLIADLVSVLILRLPQWLAELGLTLGAASPLVFAQVTALTSKWALRISQFLFDLIDSFRRLSAMVRQVDELTQALNARPRLPHQFDTADPHGPRRPDRDGDGRPDTLDPDADGNGILDDLDGNGLPDFPPPLSGRPPLPTKDLDPLFAGETDPATATNLFGVPSNGVRYLTPDELADYRVFARDGKLYSAEDGGLFDTSGGRSLHTGGSGRAIFVMDNQGNLYASEAHALGDFHHSSFLAGQPVAGAGEIVVRDGKLIEITDRSGHYKPAPNFLQQVLDQLEAQGIDVSQVQRGSW